MLARYVARLLECGRPDAHAATTETNAASDVAWTDRLKRAGYL